ncbi:MAG TPA: alpha/beta hydrolase [Anaeromyxobacteraceae bacterium]|nr:alpha/beta hydrolase [Anaeromyxobacteraceae bacterium]
MDGSPAQLATLLLPGLDGTGQLFSRFIGAASAALELRVFSYPRNVHMSYQALESLVWRELPTGRPFALLGESFSGPLALRVAARAPRGLVAVVLATTFHRRPAGPALQALRPLAPLFFRIPLAPRLVRALLAGADAPPDLVAEVCSAANSVKGSVMAARAREALRIDASEALRACPVPILFVGGRRDRLLRNSIAADIRALRPDAEIKILDGPHLLLQRRPEEVMQLVTEFLVRCASRDRGQVA